MTEKQMDKYVESELIKFIQEKYEPRDGSLTPMTSQGNGDDQFMDGYQCGYAYCLNRIAGLIGLKVEPLEQPEI